MTPSLVNTESERTSQKVVVAKFEVLYQNLPGKTEAKPQKQGSLPLGQDLHSASAKYEAGVLSTQVKHVGKAEVIIYNSDLNVGFLKYYFSVIW